MTKIVVAVAGTTDDEVQKLREWLKVNGSTDEYEPAYGAAEMEYDSEEDEYSVSFPGFLLWFPGWQLRKVISNNQPK